MVGFGEVGEERVGDLVADGCGEREGLGAVWVGFEGCDAVADEGVRDEMLVGERG